MLNSLKYAQLPPHFAIGLILGGIFLILARNPKTEFILGFPGVLAHELAHYIVAFLLFADPSPINLIPHQEEDHWVLGSVLFVSSWWSAGFTALAPLYLLPLGVCLLFHCAHEFSEGWQYIAGYLCATLAWGTMPSPKDWKIAIFNPFGILTLSGGLIFLFMMVFNGKI